MYNKTICFICNKEVGKNYIYGHVDRNHSISKIEYQSNYMNLTLKCSSCGLFFENDRKLNIHEVKNHDKEGVRRKIEKKKKENLDKSNIFCKICDKKCATNGILSVHVSKKHKEISRLEYSLKYMNPQNPSGKCMQCFCDLKFEGIVLCYNKFCSFSCSTTWYAKNTNRIETAMLTMKEREKTDPTFRRLPSQIDYWINKGFTETESKIKVSKHQTTFNLAKCIERHGKEKGTVVWKSRQLKWQKTIKDKPLKERERILKAQVSSSMSTGYSKISQKLFHSIYERIKDFNLGKVYYAENLLNGNTCSNNGEYVEFLSNGKFYLYDFYIPSINFIIEFDGDYWHSEKIKGSIERGIIRENNIKLFRPELEIVHVKECDYKSNHANVVEDLLFNITGLMTCKK